MKFRCKPDWNWNGPGLKYFVAALGVTIAAGKLLSPGAAALVVLLASVVGWFAFLRGTEIDVGSDGVLVGRKFIPYSAIKRVGRIERNGHTSGGKHAGDPYVVHVVTSVSFALKDGTTVEVGTGGVELTTDRPTRPLFNAPDPIGREIVRLVREHLDRPLRPDAGALASRIARGGESLDAWLERLKAFHEASGPTYRAGGLPREALWEVVEDGSADPSARAAALWLLRKGIDMPRLRVAIDECASPRLRVAMETAGEESDDETWKRALAELE